MGSRRQRGGGALVVAVALVGAAVGPSAAAEDPTVVLPGTTVTALTTDLDGDGDREIVRLIEEEDTVQFSLGFAVDAWEFDGARWLTIGSAAVPHAAGEPEGLVVGSQTAGLLLVQDGGRERVLTLSAAGMPGDRTGATCCLIISELGLTGRGDLELRTLQRDEAGASAVWVADVDGDGSDELVLHEGRYGATEDEQTAMLRVLRWNGTAFALAFERTDRELLYGFSVADSDGFAGKDLLFGPGTDGRLRRLAWVDGAMRLDESELDAGGTPDGWIAGAADGAIVLSLGEETRVVRWPRGQATTTVERLRTFGPFPAVTLVGDGPDALVVVQSQSGFQNGRAPSVAVHDLGLRLLGEVPASQATEGLWRFVNSPATSSGALQLNIHPYSGPIPRGVVGARAAYVSSGTLIQPGGAAGFETRPMASLVGVQPIGLAGPEDGWVVLGGPYGAPAGIAYLSWGGIPPEWGTLAVIQADQLLQPDDRTNAVAVELVDAVEVARAGQVATIMARAEGFKVAISAPAGSLVVVMNGALTDEHEVAGEPLLVQVGPPRHRQGDENVEFEAMLLVVTPDRRAITEQWAGTFVREPPEVSVSATTDAMALSATLAGRASPGSLVTAEGVAIETDDDGRFSASIDAPIWPSRIMVTARDPLGNEATELVEVVGLVDYRGMPWAAILVAATVLVGGVLYIRTPKRRAVAALPDGDGQLEELELDAVDGRETPRG